MDGFLLGARLVLACALVVAGLAKLVDRRGARRSLEQFGVPAAIVPAAAVALPLVELVVGVALIPVASAWAAALAATALLLCFTAAVAIAQMRGVEADCHCFGRISSRPVGAGTLARNVALLALAVFVVAAGASGPGTSATAWIGPLSTGEAVTLAGGVLLALLLVFNAAFLFQLFKQNGRLWAELEDLRAAVAEGSSGRPAPEIGLGEPVPAVELRDLEGERVELHDVLEGDRGTLLFFSDPQCGACDPLLPEVARRQREPDAAPRLVMISMGDPALNRVKASEHGLGPVLLQDSFDLPRSLGIAGLPGAVLVDGEARMASDPAVGAQGVSGLLAASASYEVAVIEAVR